MALTDIPKHVFHGKELDLGLQCSRRNIAVTRQKVGKKARNVRGSH